jgi:hypothetical protein
MKKILVSLFFFIASFQANAQVCNSPSGFLQSLGQFTIGDLIVFGPDCNHVQDGGGSSAVFNTAVSWFYGSTLVGVESVGNPASGSPAGTFGLTIQGVAPGATTTIHLLPAVGALNTGTTTELVIGATSGQAFGGNYGRWSFSNISPTGAGIIGEYGGTTPIPIFVQQIGIENPPGTFTTYEFWRANAVNLGEDAQAGALLFGANQPVPATKQNRLVLIKPYSGTLNSAQDSDAILWEGKSNDGATTRAEWWRQYINVTSNAGASTFLWQQNLNGGGYTNRLALSDTGQLAVGAAANAALQSNMVLGLKGSGSGSFNLGQLPGSTQYAGMWFTSSTPSATNYGFIQDSTGVDPGLYFNSGPAGTPGTIIFQTGTSTRITLQASGGLSVGGASDPGVNNVGASNFISTGANISKGTVPVGTLGTCVASSFVGGAVAGKFSAAVCAGGTIVLSSLPAVPNGYTCNAQDQTTPADTLKQTANTATSATFLATTAAADVVVFSCVGW